MGTGQPKHQTRMYELGKKAGKKHFISDCEIDPSE